MPLPCPPHRKGDLPLDGLLEGPYPGVGLTAQWGDPEGRVPTKLGFSVTIVSAASEAKVCLKRPGPPSPSAWELCTLKPQAAAVSTAACCVDCPFPLAHSSLTISWFPFWPLSSTAHTFFFFPWRILMPYSLTTPWLSGPLAKLQCQAPWVSLL